MSEPARLGYRPGLDGLRGLAVLLVVLSHLYLGAFDVAGGWVGVTVFFVLSGFLITTLLLEEYERSGRISLRGFWMRRARRLLPALLLFTAVLAALFAASGRLTEALPGLLSVIGYVGNWAQLWGVDMELFGHTWSLAVEEHFYLLWPLVVVALVHRRRLLLGAAVAVVLLGLVERVLWWPQGTLRVYFGSDTAGSLIAFGCAVALLRRRLPRMASGSGSWLLLGALLVAAVLPSYLPDGGRSVFFLPLVAFVTALTLPTLLEQPGLFGWAPLVQIGRISYGLYLWHFPILKLTAAVHPRDPLWLLLGVGLSFAAAVASWLLVERHFLRRRGTQSSTVQAPGPTSTPALGTKSSISPCGRRRR